MISTICNLFKGNKYKIIPKENLPSQGYFYPIDLEIRLSKGDIQDQINYHYGLSNSNILGTIDMIKSILKLRVNFKPGEFKFNDLRAIDIFYLFIEFVKYTTGNKVFFNGIEFSSDKFIYFDFKSIEKNYDPVTRDFVFDGWRFSLPSIGIETSLTRFSYELAIRGLSEKYQNSNYNLIYFMGNRNELEYNDVINLVETMEDLDESDQQYINNIVEKFNKSGLYFLIEGGKKPTRVTSYMLKDIWGISQ